MMSNVTVQSFVEIQKNLKRKANESSLELDIFVKKIKVDEELDSVPEAPKSVVEAVKMEVEVPVSAVELEMQRWVRDLATTDSPSTAILELLGLHAPLELYQKYQVQDVILEHLDFDEQLDEEVNELWTYIERLKPKKKCCRNLKKEWEKEMLHKYRHLDKPFFI